MSYFMLFAFIGALINEVVMAIAWSISIFIVLWCTYWFTIYCIDMYYFINVMIEIMQDELKEILDKDKK